MIELVAVMVILALLGAMAIPRFANVQASAVSAVKDGTKNAVKSAHSIAIAELRDFPTVTQLQTYIGGETPVTAAGTGIQFAINSTTYTVQTYTDSTCGSATAAVGDQVLCVGSVTP